MENQRPVLPFIADGPTPPFPVMTGRQPGVIRELVGRIGVQTVPQLTG